LAGKIEMMYNDVELREKFVGNGRRIVGGKFSVKKHVEGLETVLMGK